MVAQLLILDRPIYRCSQQTNTLLPSYLEPATNVWSVILDATSFGYNLARIYNNTIFKVQFDLAKPIKTPEAPWGLVG